MERDDLQRLIDKAHGDGFDYVDLTVEDARSLLSLIDQYKEENQKYLNALVSISMDSTYPEDAQGIAKKALGKE